MKRDEDLEAAIVAKFAVVAPLLETIIEKRRISIIASAGVRGMQRGAIRFFC